MGTYNINNEIMLVGGVSQGLYRTTPWHGVGQIKDSRGRVVGDKKQLTEDIRDPYIIRAEAGLLWEPRDVSLSDLIPGLTSNQKILIRDNYPTLDSMYDLGVHSNSYGTLSNELAVEFVAEILKHDDTAQLKSATTLYGGKVLFAVVEFRDGVRVTRGNGEQLDKHTPYMGVYWSHDGSHPLAVAYMRNEWVCMNTFTPWNSDRGLIVRHTAHARDRAADALRAIEGMMKSQDELDREIETLLSLEMDRQSFKYLLESALIGTRPLPKNTSKGGLKDNAGLAWEAKYDGLFAEWNEYTSQRTAFDAVMAVQGYEQHRQTVRGGGRAAKQITRLIKGDFPMTAKAAKKLLVGAQPVTG